MNEIGEHNGRKKCLLWRWCFFRRGGFFFAFRVLRSYFLHLYYNSVTYNDKRQGRAGRVRKRMRLFSSSSNSAGRTELPSLHAFAILFYTWLSGAESHFSNHVVVVFILVASENPSCNKANKLSSQETTCCKKYLFEGSPVPNFRAFDISKLMEDVNEPKKCRNFVCQTQSNTPCIRAVCNSYTSHSRLLLQLSNDECCG